MNLKNRVTAIIPAAGRGTRLKSRVGKPFVKVLGKPLFIHTLLALKRSFPFHHFILAVDKTRMSIAGQAVRRFKIGNVCLVEGGKTRAESVLKALMACASESEWVLVHDAARPLVSPKTVLNTIKAAKESGGAIAALPAFATVKKVQKNRRDILRTEDRERFYLAQTPQVFKRSLLLQRYRSLGKKAFLKTDDAALFDGSRTKIRLVSGEVRNIKITTPEDLDLFEYYLRRKSG